MRRRRQPKVGWPVATWPGRAIGTDVGQAGRFRAVASELRSLTRWYTGQVRIGGKAAMYPSPADHHLFVSTPQHQAVEAIIYDSHGRVKARVPVTQTAEIATQDLPAGIYFLWVEGPNGQLVVKRFSVEH